MSAGGAGEVGRSSMLIGHSVIPVGRSANPVGRSASPVGRSASPVGRSARPVGRSASPVGRSARPAGCFTVSGAPTKTGADSGSSQKMAKGAAAAAAEDGGEGLSCRSKLRIKRWTDTKTRLPYDFAQQLIKSTQD